MRCTAYSPLSISLSFSYSISLCLALSLSFAVPKMWPQQRWLVKRATAAIAACSCRRHQILEVLLALILVNCLATPTLPTAHGALITPPDIASSRTRSSSSSSSNNFDYDTASFSDEGDSDRAGDGDASLANFYRSPHRLDGYYTTADLQRSHNYKISPKPCSFGRVEGTCMFVWECIKSEGQHVGMCVDSFMFGSCCAHNYTDNIVLPQTAFAYTRPTKPLTLRPRPPAQPHKPLIRWVGGPGPDQLRYSLLLTTLCFAAA